jgi:hypothetical protein
MSDFVEYFLSIVTSDSETDERKKKGQQRA